MKIPLCAKAFGYSDCLLAGSVGKKAHIKSLGQQSEKLRGKSLAEVLQRWISTGWRRQWSRRRDCDAAGGIPPHCHAKRQITAGKYSPRTGDFDGGKIATITFCVRAYRLGARDTTKAFVDFRGGQDWWGRKLRDPKLMRFASDGKLGVDRNGLI